MRQNQGLCWHRSAIHHQDHPPSQQSRRAASPSCSMWHWLRVSTNLRSFTKQSASAAASGALTKSGVAPKGAGARRAEAAAERHRSRAAPALPFLRAAGSVNGPHSCAPGMRGSAWAGRFMLVTQGGELPDSELIALACERLCSELP